MKPVKFKEQTMVFGENQEEYGNLPAFRDANGQVVTCWKLEDGEMDELAKTGKIYLRQLTFNQPLQPVGLHVYSPFVVKNINDLEVEQEKTEGDEHS